MFSTLRTRFGIPGVISVIALVFAMIGGAYAAGGALTGSQKKEVKKISKAEAQKYANSNPGAPGAKGDTGANGKDGSNGADGSDGADGADGVSVTSEEFSGGKEGHCTGVGGSKFVASNGNTFACNGKEGSPWTALGTLPPEETLTGVFATTIGKTNFVSISFALPVVPAIAASNAVYVPSGSSKTGCPGVVGDVPQAEPGYLCVYQNAVPPTGTLNGGAPTFANTATATPGVGPAGALATFECEATTICPRAGTWAVTAPEE